MRRHRIFITASMVAGLALADRSGLVTSGAQAPPADVVLINGQVVTVDAQFSVREAVAISGGRFVGIGSTKDVQARVGPRTQVIDLKGRMVVPGFIDTHPHTFGRAQRTMASPSLVGLRSVKAIVAAIAKAAETTLQGQWIVSTPIGEPPDYFNLPESLDEKRWPTRADLDAAAPNHPVYIPIGIWPHPVIFNSEGLMRLGVTASGPPDGKGVRVERDATTGEPTGLIRGMSFYNAANPLVGKLQSLLPRRTAQEQADGLVESVRENAAAGVTTIFESHGTQPGQLEQYRALRAKGGFPGRLAFSYQVNLNQPLEQIDRWLADVKDAAGTGSGDDVIKTVGVTVALDGASQFGAAYMNEPYLDEFDQPTTGNMPTDQATLNAVAKLAAKHNIRLQFTFAGDKAGEMVLQAIEAANAETPIVGRRWLMQHFQHPTPDHVQRTKRLGLHVTSYTSVEFSKGEEVYVRRFGGDRWKSVIPTRWWFDAGVNIAQSTDGAHYQALFTLWQSLVRSDGRTGRSLMSPAKQITREEALRMYTVNGARVLFWEDRLGSIEVDKLADLVVLDRDILRHLVDDIKDAKVVLTMVGGTVVYGAP